MMQGYHLLLLLGLLVASSLVDTASIEDLEAENINIKEDHIYVVGGYKSGEYLKTVEVFQPGLNTWSEMPPMSTPRVAPAVAVLNNQLIAMGGANSQPSQPRWLNSVEKWDPVSREWANMPNLTTGRYNAGAAELQGNLFLVGGHNGSYLLPSVEKFVDNEWHVAASLPQRRIAPGVVELGGKIYAIGGSRGHDGQTRLKSVVVWDGLTWEYETEMKEVRFGPGVATLGGRIFAAGGYGEAGTSLSSVEVYDTTTKEWSNVANMNVGRWRPALVSAGRKLYTFGGIGNGGSFLTSVEEYDPETNEWTLVGDMKLGAGWVGAGVLRQ